MGLRLGDIAPDFEQNSSAGIIRFHQWLGDSWGVLFSHPADFTPVCTTELGFTARLKDEFAQRGVKAIALSVDRWSRITSGSRTLTRRRTPWSISRSSTTPTARSRPLRPDPSQRQRHPDRTLAVRDRPEQKGPVDHHLPGEHRAQFQ